MVNINAQQYIDPKTRLVSGVFSGAISPVTAGREVFLTVRSLRYMK